jgi:hypothetical protein
MTTALQRVSASLANLRSAVAAVRKPTDVRRLRPQLRGLTEAVRRAKLGIETLNEVAEQAIRLERTAGQMLRSIDRRRGGSKARKAPLKEATAELGVHKRTAQKWEALAEIPDSTFESYFLEARTAGREITLNDVLRKCRPPVERAGPFLWANWPSTFAAWQEERQGFYHAFAVWLEQPRPGRHAWWRAAKKIQKRSRP